MLAGFVHIDRGVGLVLGVPLALFDLARTTGSDQVNTCELAVGVGLFEFLPHGVGEVLDAEFERGLAGGHLILAAQSVHIAFVILAHGKGSDVELGEVESIDLALLGEDRRRAECATIQIQFVNLGVEIGSTQFGLHDLSATLEPLLDLVLALHRLRWLQREPAAFKRGHP